MFSSWGNIQPRMVDPRLALAGREQPVLPQGATHDIYGTNVVDTPEGSEVVHLALGCFWGAEKLYWNTPGVTNTAVGYMGGFTPNPTYEEACSGRTGHTETVRVAYDPAVVTFDELLRIFFENHDPTQGMRQGNDIGTQYRSAIFTTTPEQADAAAAALQRYGQAFAEAGFGEGTTDVVTEPTPFYFAEAHHQQYLDKNPNGYCPIHATGVSCT